MALETSINDIKKSESLVSAALESAKKQMIIEKGKETNIVNSKIKQTAFLLIEKEEDVKKKVQDLYDNRIVLYENLLTSIFGVYYSRLLINAIRAYINNQETLKVLSSSSDSKLSILLTEIEDNLVILSSINFNNRSSNGDGTNNPLSVSMLEKLKDSGDKLLEAFDELKNLLGFPELEMDENGKLKGLGQLYTFSTESIKGTVEFKKKEGEGFDTKQLPDNYNLIERNNGEDSLCAEINIEVKKDINIEDGTEKNPFIIRQESDFDQLAESDFDEYFKLENDITIKKGKRFIINGNLDGNGHTITLSKHSKIVFKSGKLKGSLNVIAKPSFRFFFIFPIITKINVEFGYAFSLDDGAKLNVYMDFTKYNNFNKRLLFLIPNINNFLTLKVIGTTLEDYIENINFFFKYDGNSIKRWKKDSHSINRNLINYEEDEVGKDLHLGKRRRNFNNKKITRLTTAFPSLARTEVKNMILEKGKKLTLSGDIEKIDEILYIRDMADSESSPNRVGYDFLGGRYRLNLKEMKYSYEIDDTEYVDIYPFYKFSKVSLRRFYERDENEDTDGQNQNANNNDYDALENATGPIKLLGEMADLVHDINEYEGNEDDLTITTTTLTTKLSKLRKSILSQESYTAVYLTNNLDLIKSNIQTFQYLEQQRQSEDSHYNTDFTGSLNSGFTDVYSGLESAMALEDKNGTKADCSSILLNSEMILQESKNLIIGLIESIIMLNKTIENYLLIYNFSSAYGDCLAEILDKTSTIIKNLNGTTSSSFTVINYNNIRVFSDWKYNLQKYTEDNNQSISQIYIAQELGLNSLGFSLNSKETISIFLKYLVTDAIIRSYKKGLFKNDTSKVDDIFLFEEKLEENYNLTVTLDANYELINPRLTEKIIDLEMFNDLDLSPILNGYYVLNSTDSSTRKTDILKIENLVKLIFIKYIFSDNARGNEVILRISELSEIFRNTGKNFKNTLLEYYYAKVIREIYKIADENETTIFSSDDLSILNKYIISEDDFNYMGYSINKYIAVYIFNDYLKNKAGGTILQYVGSNGLLEFLYKNKEKFTEIELEDKTLITITELVKKIWDNDLKII